jgi:hypothetical protein
MMTPSLIPYISDWISFIRQYGPMPRNDNMYDETIQRALKKKKIQPIAFETQYLGELIENFRSTSPKSVILTGTAGDGKTYYCREIWEKFGGSIEEWQQDGKLYSLALGDRELVIIKDLSELKSLEEKELYLPDIAKAILGKENTKLYLIAANDGQLIEAWTKAAQTQDINQVRQAIEELLVTDRRELEGFQVRLYNLSRQSAAIIFPRILEAVLNHPGWEECDKCIYQHQGCPIWNNKQRLAGTETDSITRERLTNLLELCELDGTHIPVRQLLLLVANTLLGHPDSKDKLLKCRQVPKIVSDNNADLASLYRNIFGDNLHPRRRESELVFSALHSFGIGIETNNQIDNILIFGSEDPELRALYQELMSNDSDYGANQKFQAQQSSYLEGDSAEGRETFLEALQTQRQRLFFTIPADRSVDMKIWDLTIFSYAEEYLYSLCKDLRNDRKAPKQIISRLARGLNRIFTGLLVNNQDELILATSGSYSQARISRICEEFISVIRRRGESVTVELDRSSNQPKLVVHLVSESQSEVKPVYFDLTLTRYEYLNRVAEGSLPSSFSQECYADILAFKTQVFKQLASRRLLECEDGDTEESMNIQILEVDSAGIANKRTVEVYF